MDCRLRGLTPLLLPCRLDHRPRWCSASALDLGSGKENLQSGEAAMLTRPACGCLLTLTKDAQSKRL